MPRVTVEAAGFVRRLFARPGDRPPAPEGTGSGERLVLSVPEGTTIEALVQLLAASHPRFAAVAFRDGRLLDSIQIVVGDRLVELAGGVDRVVADGDHVVLLPPFEGGAGDGVRP